MLKNACLKIKFLILTVCFLHFCKSFAVNSAFENAPTRMTPMEAASCVIRLAATRSNSNQQETTLGPDPALDRVRVSTRLGRPTYRIEETRYLDGRLVFPEVNYNPPPEDRVSWQWVREQLGLSRSYRNARIRLVRAGPPGGMAETFIVEIRQNGRTERKIVKVMNARSPTFSGYPRRRHLVTLMIQRQIALYRFLRQSLARYSARLGRTPQTRVAPINEERFLLNRGIFVQDFVDGTSGRELDSISLNDLRNQGAIDLFNFIRSVSSELEVPLYQHLWRYRPRNANGEPWSIDIGVEWDNFIFTGDLLHIHHTWLIDW